jgi:hypothetical protein
MEKFVYDPLETSNHIRLLSFPRARNNPSNQEYTTLPTFKLIHVTLDKAPPYEALSYVWGSLEREQKILLGTREMAITENLYTALPHLIRHTNLLWMDQICINQDDNDEKSNQVLLMSKIYEKASATIVWLGKEDGTEGDVQGLARIIDNYNAHLSFKPTVLDDVLADTARFGTRKQRHKPSFSVVHFSLHCKVNWG